MTVVKHLFHQVASLPSILATQRADSRNSAEAICRSTQVRASNHACQQDHTTDEQDSSCRAYVLRLSYSGAKLRLSRAPCTSNQVSRVRHVIERLPSKSNTSCIASKRHIPHCCGPDAEVEEVGSGCEMPVVFASSNAPLPF